MILKARVNQDVIARVTVEVRNRDLLSSQRSMHLRELGRKVWEGLGVREVEAWAASRSAGWLSEEPAPIVREVQPASALMMGSAAVESGEADRAR